MAKKFRFPLEMENGVEVRSIEELKENFSLAKILIYLSNGKLLTWLRDRYIDDIANEVEKLDCSDPNLAKKISDIFNVEYDEQSERKLEEAKEINNKISILKTFTSDKSFINVVDSIAFTQDDLYDLLDEGINTIYLCGDSFSIPISKKDVNYIGINNPVVVIDSKEIIDFKERNIKFTDVTFDNKYQKIIEFFEIIKGVSNSRESSKETNSKKYESNYISGDYSKNSLISFMLNPEDKMLSEKYYSKIKSQLDNLTYDINQDVADIKMKIIDSGLVGLAENYLNNL